MQSLMEGAQPPAQDLVGRGLEELPLTEYGAPTRAEPSRMCGETTGDCGDTGGRGDCGHSDIAGDSGVAECTGDVTEAGGGDSGRDADKGDGDVAEHTEDVTEASGDFAGHTNDVTEACNGDFGRGGDGVDRGGIAEDGDAAHGDIGSRIAGGNHGLDATGNASRCDTGIDIASCASPADAPCSDSGTGPKASGETLREGSEECAANTCGAGTSDTDGANATVVESTSASRSDDRDSGAASRGGGAPSRFGVSVQASLNAARYQVSSNPVPSAVNFGIYVDFIPLDTPEDEIIALFEPYGKVVRSFVVKKPELVTHMYAYVLLDSDDNTRRAIRALNGVRLRGNRLKVETTFGRATHIFAFGEGTAYNRSRAAVYGRMRGSSQEGGDRAPRDRADHFRGDRFEDRQDEGFRNCQDIGCINHRDDRFRDRRDDGFRDRRDDGFRVRRDDGFRDRRDDGLRDRRDDRFRDRQDDGFRNRQGNGFRGRQDSRFNNRQDQQSRYGNHKDGYTRGGGVNRGQQLHDNFGRGGGTMQRGNSNRGASDGGFMRRGERRQCDRRQDHRNGLLNHCSGGDSSGYGLSDEATERHARATRLQRKAWDRKLAAAGGDHRQWPTFDQLLDVVGNTMYQLPLYREYIPPDCGSVQDSLEISSEEQFFWSNHDDDRYGSPQDLIRLLHGEEEQCYKEVGAVDQSSEDTYLAQDAASAPECQDGVSHDTSTIERLSARHEGSSDDASDTGDRRPADEGRQRNGDECSEDMLLRDKRLDDDVTDDSGEGQLPRDIGEQEGSLEVACGEHALLRSNDNALVRKERAGSAEGNEETNAEGAPGAYSASSIAGDVSDSGGDERPINLSTLHGEKTPSCRDSTSSATKRCSEQGEEPRSCRSQLEVRTVEVPDSQPSAHGLNSEADRANLSRPDDGAVKERAQESVLMSPGLLGKSDGSVGETRQDNNSLTREEPSARPAERVRCVSAPSIVNQPHQQSAERDAPATRTHEASGNSSASRAVSVAAMLRGIVAQELGENERFRHRPCALHNNRSFAAYTAALTEARRVAWTSCGHIGYQAANENPRSTSTDSATAEEDSDSEDSSDCDGTLPKRFLSKRFVRMKNERNAIHLAYGQTVPRCVHHCARANACQPILPQGEPSASVISRCPHGASSTAREGVDGTRGEMRACFVRLRDAAAGASEPRTHGEAIVFGENGQANGVAVNVAEGQQELEPMKRVKLSTADIERQQRANAFSQAATHAIGLLAATIAGAEETHALTSSSCSDEEDDEEDYLEETSAVLENSKHAFAIDDGQRANVESLKPTVDIQLKAEAGDSELEASSADDPVVQVSCPTAPQNAGNNANTSMLEGPDEGKAVQKRDDSSDSTLGASKVAADQTKPAKVVDDLKNGGGIHCGGGGDDGNRAFEKGAQDGGAKQQRRPEAGSEQQKARCSRDVGRGEAGGDGHDDGCDDAVDMRRRQPPRLDGEEIECEPVLAQPS